MAGTGAWHVGIGVLRISPEDRAATYACDPLIPPPSIEMFRAVDVAAPPSIVFRWLCQLKVAPYSYDRLDNGGRRSPQELTPGADALAVGQRYVLGTIVSFERDGHITCRTTPAQERMYGPVAATYAVRPWDDGGCRIVIKGVLGARGRLGGLRARLLSAADLPMSRKQLLTLKRLAERDAALMPAVRAAS